MEAKEIKKYADLYGYDIIITELKKTFNLVSFARNSIPTLGSLTLPIKRLKKNSDAIINRVILHKTNEITVSCYSSGLDLYIYRCEEHKHEPCLFEPIDKLPPRDWEHYRQEIYNQ